MRKHRVKQVDMSSIIINVLSSTTLLFSWLCVPLEALVMVVLRPCCSLVVASDVSCWPTMVMRSLIPVKSAGSHFYGSYPLP